MSAPAFLVELLLPMETGQGKPIEQGWFEALLKELTETFGGATSFVRTPGQGLWRTGGETERDDIAVIEVMTEKLAPAFGRRCANGWKTSFPKMKSSFGRRRSPACEPGPNYPNGPTGTHATSTIVSPHEARG